MNETNDTYTLFDKRSATALLEEGKLYLEKPSEFDSSYAANQYYYVGQDVQIGAISWRPQDTTMDKELRKRFNDLAETWKGETRFLSSISDIIIHPAHLQIVAMGPKAVPLILNRMKQEAGLWFWALNFITGENPVTEDIRGNIKAMSEAWLDWGCNSGYC